MSAKWESLSEIPNEEIEPEQRARFLGMWMEHRHVFGYTLLAELPDLLRQALRDHDDILGLDYDLLIVDEYQDLNACDLDVLQRLAQREIKILAIGDDDQSIYSFRKAAPTGIRRFPTDYAIRPQFDCQLTVCQRSPRAIFNWAQFVIQGLPDRDRTRPLPTFSQVAPEGSCALLRFPDDDSEAHGVANLITWLHTKKGIPLPEILVLYRTDNFGSSFTDRVVDVLTDEIEISQPNRIYQVLNDPNNRLLLATLHLIDFPTDSLAWRTLLKSRRGLGDAFVNQLYDRAVALNTSFGEALAREAQNVFSNWPTTLTRQIQPALSIWTETRNRIEALPEKEDAIRWSKWIVDNIESGHLPNCSQEFKDLLVGVDELIETDGHDLGRFLSQIQPKGKDLYQSKSTGVRFMTMTGSKGLTAQATIVVGVDNDLIPHPRGDMNEERRLLYVAMTRPKEYLFMTWAARRTGYVVHSGRENYGRRQYSEFLRGGPVESQDGQRHIQQLVNS
jgi:DNA helicase-2/ATP-dependent DNA helicase PcrA